MIKKAIVAMVVIVAAAAIVFAAVNADQKNPTNNSANSSSENQQNTTNNTTVADNSINPKTDATNISAVEAKKIAEKYIEQPGAYAGTPKLIKQSGNLVYSVPVIYNGQIVGEIDINAQTGDNVGGGGGAP